MTIVLAVALHSSQGKRHKSDAAEEQVYYSDLASYTHREYRSCSQGTRHKSAAAEGKVLFFVDNTACLSACVHGYARSPHMATLANALHLALAQLKCHAWWEYVPSQANGADLPSRPHSAEASEFYDKEGFQVWPSPLRLPSFDNLRYPRLEDVDI
jgi:hypothetical protein